MRPCLSEATTMPGTFAEDIDHFADAGCPAMEVWLTKLEAHLETQSLADTKKHLDARGMTLAAAAYQGGLLLSQGEARKAHFDHFRKRLDICQAFAIPTLLVVADFVQAAFAHVGIDDWQSRVEVDPNFIRPTDVRNCSTRGQAGS